MSTCKDCLHSEICPWDCDSVVCERFKDKSKFIELPCKVGDKVYFIKHNSILPTKAKWFETNAYGWCVCCEYPPLATLSFKFDDFGKTVFLTKEEAEKALNEVRNEDRNEVRNNA